MKKGSHFHSTQITVVLDQKGESIEEMLRRVRDSKEPIQANAKMLYFDRKDGVMPFCDIRSDRFDYAMKATNKLHATAYAQRMTEDGFTQDEKGNWIKQQQATGGEA